MQSGMKIVTLGRWVGFGYPLSYIPIWGHKAGILFFENETMFTFWKVLRQFSKCQTQWDCAQIPC
jgi:hypothetical protein